MNTMHIKMMNVILFIVGVFSFGINIMGEDQLDKQRFGNSWFLLWCSDHQRCVRSLFSTLFPLHGSSQRSAYIGVLEFQVFEMNPNANNTRISFSTQSDWLYTLQQRNDLQSGNWTNVLGQASVPGTGCTLTLQDTCTDAVRFYRIQINAIP